MSRATSGRAAATLRDGYRVPHADDWLRCKQIAEQMQGLDGAAGSETQYALGYSAAGHGTDDHERFLAASDGIGQ